ncbi:MAG: hypothetical protein HZA67_01825 [Rhodospirillales bacterium]|nr:hypothetical protein [Rhodospirillales bacterium]
MKRFELPWQELAEDTYRSVFSQSKTALDISGLWLMVGVLMTFLGFGIFPQLTPEDVGGLEAYYAAPSVLGLVALLGLSVFATRWTRWVTLNYLTPPGQTFSLGKAELRTGMAILATLIFGVGPIVAGFLFAPKLLDQGQVEAAFLAQGAGVVFGTFLLARSAMAVNLAALQIPGNSLVYAWGISAGQTVRLLLLLVITAGPAVLAAWGVEWVLAWAIAPMPDLIDPEMLKALSFAMMAALGFLGLMLFLGAMGLAARSLILAGDDPWARVGGADLVEEEEHPPVAIADLEESVLETSLEEAVEEPLPLSAYADWVEPQPQSQPQYPPQAQPLQQQQIYAYEMPVAEPEPPPPTLPPLPAPRRGEEQLVPPQSQSWMDPSQPSAARTGRMPTGKGLAEDENVLGRKIGKAKKKGSWTRFLPTLEFDMGAEAGKLAVLVVLMVLGYLFLFTDVIEKYLL